MLGWAPGKTQQFLNSPIFHTKIKEIPLKNKSYISMLRAHTYAQPDPRKSKVAACLHSALANKEIDSALSNIYRA